MHHSMPHNPPGDRRMNRMSASLLSIAITAALIVAPAACTSKAPKSSAQPHHLATVEGLSQPEALSFDPAQNVYFVSNVNGSPGVKDGNGFISRISADGAMDSLHFIQGGRDSVQLDAPMGSRVQGDTLWVVDVDKLRGFDTRTGKPVATIDLSPLKPLFLNDIAIDSTGEFYITDTGVRIDANGKRDASRPRPHSPRRARSKSQRRRVNGAALESRRHRMGSARQALRACAVRRPIRADLAHRRPGTQGRRDRQGDVRRCRGRTERTGSHYELERLQCLHTRGLEARSAHRQSPVPAGRRLDGCRALARRDRVARRESIRALGMATEVTHELAHLHERKREHMHGSHTFADSRAHRRRGNRSRRVREGRQARGR